MEFVVDRISSIDVVDDVKCIRIVLPPNKLLCVCGMVVREGSLSPYDCVRVENGWMTVKRLWEKGVYSHYAMFDSRTLELSLDSEVEFMTRTPGLKMFRIETESGRCALVGAKVQFHNVECKPLRVRKLKSGGKLLCLRF